MTSDFGLILKSYCELFVFALRRIRLTRDDLSSLTFAFLASLLYFVGFKGELKTPIGRLLVTDRNVLRSFTYGFFKTHLTYNQFLRTKYSGSLFFPVVLDVGANIGDFTLTIKNHSGKIIAIEPGQENFTALRANLRINGTQNVIPLHAAAHNKNEEVFLDGESSNLYVSEKKRGQSVNGMTIDLMLHELRIFHVDLVKIDVQGHEKAVLEGMHDMLEGRLVNLLVIEVHLKRGVSVEDILSFMKRYGYRLIYKDDFLYEQSHLYFYSGNSC